MHVNLAPFAAPQVMYLQEALKLEIMQALWFFLVLPTRPNCLVIYIRHCLARQTTMDD